MKREFPKARTDSWALETRTKCQGGRFERAGGRGWDPGEIRKEWDDPPRVGGGGRRKMWREGLRNSLKKNDAVRPTPLELKGTKTQMQDDVCLELCDTGKRRLAMCRRYRATILIIMINIYYGVKR
jgi:hypothetical protein